MKPRKTYSTKCKHCFKIVRVKPSGGDWLNDIYPIRHKNKHGARCDGMFQEVATKDLIEP